MFVHIAAAHIQDWQLSIEGWRTCRRPAYTGDLSLLILPCPCLIPHPPLSLPILTCLSSSSPSRTAHCCRQVVKDMCTSHGNNWSLKPGADF